MVTCSPPAVTGRLLYEQCGIGASASWPSPYTWIPVTCALATWLFIPVCCTTVGPSWVRRWFEWHGRIWWPLCQPPPRGGPLAAPPPSHAPASGHDTTFVTASAPSTDLVPTTNLLQTKLTRFMSPSRGEVKGSLPLCRHATLRVRIRPIKRLLGACVPAIGGSTWDAVLLFCT